MARKPTCADLQRRVEELERQAGELRQTERKLRESEEKYRSLFSQSVSAIYLHDLEGRILEVNPAACLQTGYSREELLRLTVFDLHPDRRGASAADAGEILRQWRQWRPEQRHFLQAEHRRRDGSVFPVDVSTGVVRFADRSLILAIIQDATERKQAQEALQQREAHWRWVMENALDVFCVFDPATRTIGYVSPAVRQWGIPAEALVGRRFTDFVHPDDIDRVLQDVQATVATGRESMSEFRVLGPQGRVLSIEQLGRAVGQPGAVVQVITVLRDVSERKRVEQALRQSEERFRLLVEDAPFGLSLMRADRSFEFFNQQFTGMLGYTLEDIPDKDTWFRKAYPDPAYREKVIRTWTADLGPGAEVGRIRARVFQVRCKDGQDKIVHFRSVPLEDGRQVLTYEDITERVRSEQERERLQAQLNQAQKMESVGRLAGGVAHDFNNMLQAILGHTEMALAGLDPAQPLHAELQEIRTAAERSAELTRQLLAFARKQTIAPRVLDLNEVVEATLKMLRRLIGEDIDLAWLPGRDLGSVKVDPGQIDQILANLAVNARDAIHGVGKLTIETGAAVLDEAYASRHAGFAPGRYVLLAVSDTGHGMDRQILAHVFEPFFTTKQVGKGTGLGLATVYGIVKQNGGFINVYSEPGLGTTFKIYLPRHEPGPEQAAGPEPAQPVTGGGETVLLVEDEPAILDMTVQMLERLGYSVLGARTPGDALRLAEEHRGEVRLLVTDVIMPEMNGRELAAKLGELCPGLKHLFMSGYTANAIVHHGVLNEGVHFLQKPFSMKDLAARVRQVLDSR